MLKKLCSLPLALSLWLIIRLAYNPLRQLVPDEAYYWVWSRHLAAGYLDHPPMIALLIHAATSVFGNTEFAVRLPATLLAFGTIAVALAMSPDKRQTRWIAAILLLSPMPAVLGSISAPDTPACFFSLCALAAACRASPAGWLAWGAFTGLCVDSKYTAVLPAAAIAAAIFTSPAGRQQLRRPWPWLGFLLSLAIFSPVVAWNYHHDWISFRFQLHHGSTDSAPSNPLLNVLSYFAGQLGLYTPVLFILGILALVWQWRRYASLSLADRMILFSATLPLLFFAATSLRRRPELNWPVFAYWPLTLILAAWLADRWLASRLSAARTGIAIAAVITVVAHIPEIIELIPVNRLPTIPSRWDDMFGWRDLAAAVDERLSTPAVVFCTSYENASELEFYLTNHPEVWTIDSDRPTEFDLLPNRPALASLSRVIYVTRFAEDAAIPKALSDFQSAAMQPFATEALGRAIRRRWIIDARK